MARIPYLPVDLAEPRDLVDSIRARRGGKLVQIDRIMLHCPHLASGWNAWVGAVRASAALTPYQKELATCATVILTDCEYEIVRHAPVFLKEGGSQAQLDALADLPAAARNEALFNSMERAILQLTFEMTRLVDVRPETFDAAARAVGSPQAILELVAVVGTYNMAARMLKALDLEVQL